MVEEIDKERPEFLSSKKVNLKENLKVNLKEVIEQINISIKYEGYIDRQKKQVSHFKKLENKRIPADIDYSKVKNLRIEARQKLEQIRPESIGQASRISGVSPADVNMILLYITMA